MVDKQVANINMSFLVSFDIVIQCQNCQSVFEASIDGSRDRKRIRCKECGHKNKPKSVIRSVMDIGSDKSNYTVQNNSNRSITITRDDRSFMIWGTGTISSTGNYDIEERTEFVESSIKNLFGEDAKIVSSDVSNISIILDIGRAIDIRGMYRNLKNDSSSPVSNVKIDGDSVDGFQRLSIDYKKDTHVSIFNTGKIKVSTDELEVADSIYRDVSRYVEDNFSQIVKAPPKMKEKESMYMFGESSSLELSEHDKKVLKKNSNYTG